MTTEISGPRYCLMKHSSKGFIKEMEKIGNECEFDKDYDLTHIGCHVYVKVIEDDPEKFPLIQQAFENYIHQYAIDLSSSGLIYEDFIKKEYYPNGLCSKKLTNLEDAFEEISRLRSEVDYLKKKLNNMIYS